MPRLPPAIILAAGRGSPFGETPKLLADWCGLPLVRHVANAALGADARPILVVVGHRSPDVTAALTGLDVTYVENDAYAEGLSTSLRAGWAALPERAHGALILLGDMPLVTARLLVGLSAAWHEAGCPAAAGPVHAGRRGNPVLLSRRLDAEIARLVGDTGAGPLLRGRSDVLEWPSDDPAVAADIDTREALARLPQVARANTTPPSTAE